MKTIEVKIPASLWEKMKQLREAGHFEGMTEAQAVKFLVGLGLEVQK